MGEDSPNLDDHLERHRELLCLLARMQLSPKLRGKVDASDIAQQTLLEAHRDQNQLQGQSENEQAAWLRKILVRNLADEYRKYGRDKRDVALEQSLQTSMQKSSCRLEALLPAEQTSPSQAVARNEQMLKLANALAQLPDDQRRAVEQHHLQGKTSAEIARMLGRTEVAVAGLLRRGMKKLRGLLQAEKRD